MEDLDEIYKQEIEKADIEFTKLLENRKSNQETEKLYSKKLKDAQKNYNSRLIKLLKSQKNQKKIIEKRKSEKNPVFKVQPLDLKSHLKENFENKKNFFFFKARIKYKNFKQKITPEFLAIWRLKIRIFFKLKNKQISQNLSDISIGIKSTSIEVQEFSKKLAIKIYMALKNIANKLTSKTKSFLKIFSKGKKEEKELIKALVILTPFLSSLH